MFDEENGVLLKPGNSRPTFLPILRNQEPKVSLNPLSTDSAQSQEKFCRVGSVKNAPWFNLRKGNVLWGILENLYEREDERGKSKFFQVRSLEGCECRLGRGEDTRIFRVEAGTVVNLNCNPRTAGLEDLIPLICRGAEWEVWVHVLGRKGLLWDFDIQKRVRSAHFSAGEEHDPDPVSAVLVHGIQIEDRFDGVFPALADIESAFDGIDGKGGERFKSMFRDRFHVELEFGAEHSTKDDGSSNYDKMEDLSQSSSHENMSKLIRHLAVQSGVGIYPRNVGIRGVWGMADMLLVSGDRYLFVEIQSDHALQDPKRLERKLVLANQVPLLFVVSPLADVQPLLDRNIGKDAILVADTRENTIALLSSYRGIECVSCGTSTMASGLGASSSLQLPICLSCERKQGPVMRVLVRFWNKLAKRIREWSAKNMDTRLALDALVCLFMEKVTSTQRIQFTSNPGFVIEASWSKTCHGRKVSISLSGRECNRNRGKGRNTEVDLGREGYFDLNLRVSIEEVWCSSCHRKPGTRSREAVYGTEKCENCGKVHHVREKCCELCRTAYPHDSNWTSQRGCRLCGHPGCVGCVPWISGLTRERLHPKYVSMDRFMWFHNNGMRQSTREVDSFRNMPITCLLHSRKWDGHCRGVGMSTSKALRWRRKLVAAAIKELGMSQSVSSCDLSSNVVSHGVEGSPSMRIKAGHICGACSGKFQSLEDQLETHRKILLRKFRKLLNRLPSSENRILKCFKNPWVHLVPDITVHAEALECSGDIVKLKLLSGCDVQNCRRLPPPEFQKISRWAPVGTVVSLEWAYLVHSLNNHQLPSAVWIRVDSNGGRDLRLKGLEP